MSNTSAHDPNPHPHDTLESDTEFSPIDISLLPGSFAAHVLSLPLPLFKLPEETLATLCKPTRQQVQLKIRFHEGLLILQKEFMQNSAHYANLHDAGSPQPQPILDLAKVTSGICSAGLFRDWCGSKNFLAWFITPQPPQEVIISELLYTGISNLREILTLPIYDGDGKTLTSLVNTQLAIVKMLDARKNGAPTIKSEAKIMTQNIPAPQIIPLPDPQDTASEALSEANLLLLQRIEALEKSRRIAPKLISASTSASAITIAKTVDV